MFHKVINYAGVICLLQAVTQVTFSSIAIAQYFCAVDFLNNNGPSVLLKIMYYINPDTCGNTVNIGNAIPGIPNQAFVLFRSEPMTSTRTYIINVTSLVLGCIWAMACCLLLAGGTRNQYPRSLRWPWITATVSICAVDVVASITFANDSFHTKSLSDIITYIGATASGIGLTTIDTSTTAWIMVLVYSRCVVMFVVNVVLMVFVAMHVDETEAQVVETPRETTLTPVPPPMPLIENPIYSSARTVCDESTIIQNDEDNTEKVCENIPRANLSQAYRKMKKKLFIQTHVDKSKQKHEIALELAKYSLETSRPNTAVALQPWSYTTTKPFRKRETVRQPNYTADREYHRR
ncbi:uncharacterized protein [Maniola hyperantus]|uniref:uncharacterized protein isoform X2 n=1 Tax=Aphantopus hyperantus TaxID=2795564 RepID=UPI00212F711D